tara:strand:+ start:150 stop:449 length:300 start_codon:yes stop_codon:yes gene_type:complete
MLYLKILKDYPQHQGLLEVHQKDILLHLLLLELEKDLQQLVKLLLELLLKEKLYNYLRQFLEILYIPQHLLHHHHFFLHLHHQLPLNNLLYLNLLELLH